MRVKYLLIVIALHTLCHSKTDGNH